MHPQTRAERIVHAQRQSARASLLERFAESAAPMRPRPDRNEYPFHRVTAEQLQVAARILS